MAETNDNQPNGDKPKGDKPQKQSNKPKHEGPTIRFARRVVANNCVVYEKGQKVQLTERQLADLRLDNSLYERLD